MSKRNQAAARDRENPDPEELNKPIPKILLVVVAVLLGWAITYIVRQAPSLESSSSTGAPQQAGSEKAS